MRLQIWLASLAIAAQAGCGDSERMTEPAADFRIAIFNIRELSTAKLTDVDSTGAGRDQQVLAAAGVIQRVRPDILVINEIDHDYDSQDQGLEANARRFVSAYLNQGDQPIDFEHVYAAPCNTGILSGVDLDGDGLAADDSMRQDRRHGQDSYGFGLYPGQYSMAVLSRLPLKPQQARTFRRLLWKDLPDNLIPADHYSAEALEVFRLSSKSHWDLPVRIGPDSTLHLLISHPTPRGFDGPEDRNGRRNYDEIRLWKHYLNNEPSLYDDNGGRGGFESTQPFVIIGDLNSSPRATESLYDGKPAIAQLLEHPLIQDTSALCTSQGALKGREAGAPDYHERNTIVWGDGSQIDYILPSRERGLQVRAGGVFWPTAESDPQGARMAEDASDHRLVWLDLRFRPDASRD